MEIVFNGNIVPYLDFRLILRKMWTLFGKRFRIYPLKTIK